MCITICHWMSTFKKKNVYFMYLHYVRSSFSSFTFSNNNIYRALTLGQPVC